MTTTPQPALRRSTPRLAVVGLGGMGALHARNIARNLASAELTALVDVDVDRCSSLAAALGGMPLSSNDAAIESSEVDAIVLATPTSGHEPLVAAALDAGKHVFCEKPLTLDRRSTQRLLASAKEAGLVLQVGFHRRFDPAWRALACATANGDVGEVRLFRASQRDQAPPESISFLEEFGSLFVDALIHELDCARWLVGEVTGVHAFGASLTTSEYAAHGDADNALLILQFESGALGVVDYSRCARYGYECSAELLGELLTLRLGNNPQPVDVERLSPGARAVRLPATHQERHGAAYLAELDHFARAIAGEARSDASAHDVEAALALALAAARSLREQRFVAVDNLAASRDVG